VNLPVFARFHRIFPAFALELLLIARFIPGKPWQKKHRQEHYSRQ